MYRRIKKRLIENIKDLIKTLECDELRFLEIIEPEQEKEIEIIMSKKIVYNRILKIQMTTQPRLY